MLQLNIRVIYCESCWRGRKNFFHDVFYSLQKGKQQSLDFTDKVVSSQKVKHKIRTFEFSVVILPLCPPPPPILQFQMLLLLWSVTVVRKLNPRKVNPKTEPTKSEPTKTEPEN